MGVRLSGLLLLGLVLTSACTGYARWGGEVLPMLGAPPSEREFDVSFPYVATLLNALESAATDPKVRNPYQEWLSVAPQLVPQWLTGYRAARFGWLRGPYFQHLDASFVPHLRCGYREASVATMARCVERVLPPGEGDRARSAIEAADAGLRWRWQTLEPALRQSARQLSFTLNGAEAAALTLRLRQMLGLSPYAPLYSRVVVVATPAGVTRLGRREDNVLIIEVSAEEAMARPLLTVFHEFAHLAVTYAPAVEAMEAEFVRLGYFGAVCSHYWNEVVATAYEQMAAERFDPHFTLDRELYGDAAIDAMARAMYLDWRADPSLRLGQDFARRMTSLARRHWPMSKWRLKDLLFRVVLFSNDPQILQAFRRSSRVHAFWGVSPLPDYADRPLNTPPAVTRLLFIEKAAVRRHRPLLQQFGVQPEEVELYVQDVPLLYRTDDPAGLPLLLVVAASQQALRQAAVQLGEQADELPVPSHGWHAL